MLKKSDPLRQSETMTERVALFGICCNEPEGRAFAQRALHAEAEAVLLEDGLGDGKAQPGALLAGVRTGAVVAVEDIGQVGGGDAGAVVLHLHADPFGAAGSPQDKDAVRTVRFSPVSPMMSIR